MFFLPFGSFFFSKCAAEQTKAKRQHGKIYHQQHDTLSLAHTCTHSHAHLHVHTRTHTHVSKGGSLAEPTDVWPEGNWPQGFDFDGSDDVEIFFPANRLGFKLDELFRKRKLIFFVSVLFRSSWGRNCVARWRCSSTVIVQWSSKIKLDIRVLVRIRAVTMLRLASFLWFVENEIVLGN